MDEKWAGAHTSCRVSCYNSWRTLHRGAVRSRFSSPSAFSCGWFGFGLIIPERLLTLCSLKEEMSLRGVTLSPHLLLPSVLLPSSVLLAALKDVPRCSVQAGTRGCSRRKSSLLTRQETSPDPDRGVALCQEPAAPSSSLCSSCGAVRCQSGGSWMEPRGSRQSCPFHQTSFIPTSFIISCSGCV